MKVKIESQLYRWGWVFFIVVAAVTVMHHIFFPQFRIREYMRPCVFYTMTGYYCPGCGGTRSVAALFSGHFLVSAVNFPMVVYCAAVYGWFMISHTVEKLSRHKIRIGMKYHPAWLYGSLVIVAVHCIVKNIFYMKTGIPPFL